MLRWYAKMPNELSLYDDVSLIKGVGEKKRARLAKLGISSVGDMLDHLPVRYQDMRTVTVSCDFREGTDLLAEGVLIKKNTRRTSSYKTLVELVLRDGAGLFYASFFNMPYAANMVNIGETYSLFGRMRYRNGIKLFTNPLIVESGSDKDVRGILPIYRCTQGITNNDFRKWMREAGKATQIEDWLSNEIRQERNLCDLSSAYENIHFPSDERWYKIARYRLVYDKILIYQIALWKNRAILESENSDSAVDDYPIDEFVGNLPFSLTAGQQEAIAEIEANLIEPKPMNRLVQGDVGCGKTVVAEAAIFKVAKSGKQAAFMAPTEILARQHYANLKGDLERHGIKVELLVSGLRASERREILERLATGTSDVAVGTHALIQDDIEFKDLSLAITDEQHRFGVNQRKTLVQKGASNILVMSATPIPRTLAATVFGDMDFSIIKTKPENRLPIITRKADKSSREKAYRFLLSELEAGNQGYVVAPSIEDDPESDLASAEALYKEMVRRYRGHKVSLIHGRMDKAEKESIMAAFCDGKADLLVSTVVIEVGIDVPNATVMLIENAERFGLAQLHQLRGRVGRSEKQSYCYLICYSDSDQAVERMDILVNTNNGFEISEADFQMRGAGDLMGTMQHGISGNDLYTTMYRYPDVVEKAGLDAKSIISDESLANQEYLRKRLVAMYAVDNSDIL